MKVIILGADGTGRELLGRLGDVWEPVVVDPDPSRLSGADGIRPFEAVAGDGSSLVVLRRAGLEEAVALVAATPSDDVNLEAIRLALEAGLLRVVGVAADPERIEDYRALGVPVYAPHTLAARSVELALEPRRVASSAFAGGKAEAIELELSPDAAVVGHRLRDLHSSTWVVAAVLRAGRVVIPHGDTVLEAGDRVTVVGSAAHYTSIVSAFTTGVSRFPLAFGRKVAVALTSEADLDGALVEAVNMVRNSQADVLTIVHDEIDDTTDGGGAVDGVGLLEKAKARVDGVEVELRAAEGSAKESLATLAGDESIGVLVAPAPAAGERFGRFKIARALNELSQGRVPLLLARSGTRYDSIVVPARRTPAGDIALRAAIDLAEVSALPLTGIAAAAPNFVATRVDTIEAARSAVEWLREEAAVRGVVAATQVVQGNPVRVITESAPRSSLLVIGAPRHPARAFSLGISGLVAARSHSSVLLVPGPT